MTVLLPSSVHVAVLHFFRKFDTHVIYPRGFILELCHVVIQLGKTRDLSEYEAIRADQKGPEPAEITYKYVMPFHVMLFMHLKKKKKKKTLTTQGL